MDGKVTDELTEHTGFRTIAWKDQRFYLNGREVQFRGVNKHEQTEYEWNAVSDDDVASGMAMDGRHGRERRASPALPAQRAGIQHRRRAGHRGVGGEWLRGPDLERCGQRGKDGHARRRAAHARNGAPELESSRDPFLERGQRNHRGCGQPLRRRDSRGKRSHAARHLRGQRRRSRRTAISSRTTPTTAGMSGIIPSSPKLPRNAVVSETGSGDWITHHVPYGTFQVVGGQIRAGGILGDFHRVPAANHLPR